MVIRFFPIRVRRISRSVQLPVTIRCHPFGAGEMVLEGLPRTIGLAIRIDVDDSGHIETPKQVPEVVRQLKPRVIIPSHYFIKGIVNPSYTVLTPDRWFIAQKHKQLTGASHFTLSGKGLDRLKLADGEFLALYFENNVAFQIIFPIIPDGWEDQNERGCLAKYKAANK